MQEKHGSPSCFVGDVHLRIVVVVVNQLFFQPPQSFLFVGILFGVELLDEVGSEDQNWKRGLFLLSFCQLRGNFVVVVELAFTQELICLRTENITVLVRLGFFGFRLLCQF